MSAPTVPPAPSATTAPRPALGASSGTGAMLPAHYRDAVLPFAESVVRQVAHPLGAARGDAAEREAREHRIAERLTAILRLACGVGDGSQAVPDEELDRAAALLADDTALLSACFQNTDLLPHAGSHAADAVAVLVLRAMERLAATPAPPPVTPGR